MLVFLKFLLFLQQRRVELDVLRVLLSQPASELSVSPFSRECCAKALI